LGMSDFRPRIGLVLGTRPEAIKMAPLISELRSRPAEFDPVVISTAQHRQMLDQVLSTFAIVPDMDLDLMRSDQNLGDLTARLISSMQQKLLELQPHLLLVQGDTTTAFASALAAYY